MIFATWLASCSGDKTVPTVDSDPSVLEHTGTPPPAHTGEGWPPAHTGTDADCEVVEAPPTWSVTDDPCAVIEGKRFLHSSCSTAWFHNGLFHIRDRGGGPSNMRYQCRSEAGVAYLSACWINDGQFAFYLSSGVLFVDGYPYTFVADDWHDHSGTTLGYWFYTDTGYEPPSFCDTGL